MTVTAPLAGRLEFLARVTGKECLHLLDTDRRLFAIPFTAEVARAMTADPVLAERLDAFVGRFGRLQDTLGDKLLPALLLGLAETPGAAMDNLDKAEKFGLIEWVDVWMELRRVRNQMVHYYIEDLTILSSPLRRGHDFVPTLVASAHRGVAEARRVLWA